tara:strand:- start:185 stop:544 length:360 start_codon:yes stop_codon:yes gene_type:complete
MSDVYKVLTISEWDESLKSGLIETSLDEKDGFIHFSSSSQLALTLNLYFKSDTKVMLLQIDEEKLNSPLVYEEAGGDRIGKFPHLYDKLSVQSISKKWELNRNAFELPNEILKYIEDRK